MKKKTDYPFENKKMPLLDRKTFAKRQMQFFLYAMVLILLSLGIGVIGYRWIGHRNLTDAIYDASMILTGMGPGENFSENGLKIFTSLYSLFSGVIFLSIVAVMFAPVLHRFMHRIHLEE